jgi:hypothetical protein
MRVALRNARTEPPPDRAALQLGAASALYLLWLVAWLVLGSSVFGPAHHNWSQTLAAAVGALLAFASQCSTAYLLTGASSRPCS